MSETESIIVALRIRPFVATTFNRLNKADTEIEWEADGDKGIVNTRTKQSYTFDYVFGDSTSTLTVYKLVAEPLVKMILQGLNASIFAYGQTCSGKTYTMRGDSENPGIMVLAIKEIFNAIRAKENCDFMVRVSFLEVYNETVNDLLEPKNKNLDVREGQGRGVYIENLTEHTVRCYDEAIHWMYYGDHLRKTGSTNMNQESSRSHSIFRVALEMQTDELTTVSYLNLIDLAGSEGVHKTGAEEARLREGSSINRSLLYLSTVIQKLSEASTRGSKKDFINFRDSKLTRILQSSLNGNSRTAIVCNITPTCLQYTETLNTILFGTRAKAIKTQAKVNEVHTSESLLLKTKAEIENLKKSRQLYLKKIGTAEAELANMGQSLKAKDEYIAELQQSYSEEVRECRQKIEDYENKIKGLDSKIMRSAEKLSRAAGPSPDSFRIVHLPDFTLDFAESGALQSRVLELEEQLEAERLEFKRLKELNDDRYQEKVMELDSFGFTLHDASSSEVGKWKNQIAKLTEELESTRSRLAQLEFIELEAESVKQAHDNLQYRAAQDASYLQQLQVENQQLRAAVDSISGEKESEAQRALNYQVQSEQLRQDLEMLSMNRATDLASSPQPVDSCAGENRQPQGLLINELQRANSDLIARLDKTETQLIEAEARLASSSFQHVDMKLEEDRSSEIEALQAQLNAALKSRDETRIELYTVSRHLETSKQKQAELEDSLRQLQYDEKRKAKAKVKTEAELLKMSREIEDLKSQLRESEKFRQTAIDERRLAEHELSNLFQDKDQLEANLAYQTRDNEELKRSNVLLYDEVCRLTQRTEIMESSDYPQSESWRLKLDLMDMRELNSNLMRRNDEISAALQTSEENYKQQLIQTHKANEEKRLIARNYSRCNEELKIIKSRSKLNIGTTIEEYDRLQAKCIEYLTQSEEYCQARDQAIMKSCNLSSELHNCKLHVISLEERLLLTNDEAKFKRRSEEQREVIEKDEAGRRRF